MYLLGKQAAQTLKNVRKQSNQPSGKDYFLKSKYINPTD